MSSNDVPIAKRVIAVVETFSLTVQPSIVASSSTTVVTAPMMAKVMIKANQPPHICLRGIAEKTTFLKNQLDSF